MAFVDYENFGSTKAVMKALEEQWIENNLFEIFDNSTAQIKLYRLSNKLQLEKGVRYGDNLSPKYFTAQILKDLFRRLCLVGRV